MTFDRWELEDLRHAMDLWRLNLLAQQGLADEGDWSRYHRLAAKLEKAADEYPVRVPLGPFGQLGVPDQ